MDVLTLAAAIGVVLLLLNSSDRKCGRRDHPSGSHNNLYFFCNDGGDEVLADYYGFYYPVCLALTNPIANRYDRQRFEIRNNWDSSQLLAGIGVFILCSFSMFHKEH